MALTKRVKTWKAKVQPGKQYPIEDALKLIKELATSKFNESVDAAVNLGIDASKSDQQVRGSTVMPHGIGKTVRVAVFTSGKNQELAKAAAAACLPMTVVYGENDDAWPTDEQDEMAMRLSADRVCIPGAAHSPAIEAPMTTASILTDFWNEAERRQPTVHSCGRAKRATAAGAVTDQAG